ncbi:MAG: GNAT family N-acetyltransferase [Actinobacteria bacterium HGW-Actinobacteria-4]|nr:MAG: GNAT family N-acetyltransferase [Actinobacteria bacterium HGW-Actinobacteria-4]
MARAYITPQHLRPDHNLEAFECSSAEQASWLRDHARQSVAGSHTRVLVVTARSSPDVVGYFAWTMAHLDLADAPDRLRRGAGNYPAPVALLARLGVDQRHEGVGVGAGLLRDVMFRTVAVADQIGCRALLVHCENANARDFYLRHVPDFEVSPTDPMHLVLLVKDIRKALSA